MRRYSSQPSQLHFTLFQALAIIVAIAGIALIISIVARQQNLNSQFDGLVKQVASFQSAMKDAKLPQLVPILEQRFTVLVMGVDSNGSNAPRFVGTRSDTMMLISFNPQAKTVNIVSIPRDSRVKLAGDHGVDKINAAHAFGGPDLAVSTVQQAFSVPCDRYLVIDVQGLRQALNILGPLPILVEKRMHYTDRAAHLKIALDSGMQTLTAEQVEQYVRFRHDARGDIGRIERQQWFLRQVSDKLKDPRILVQLPELFKLANQYVVTNLSMDEMVRLANFLKDVKPNQIQTAMLPGHAATVRGGSYWIIDPFASAVVFNRLLGTTLNASEAGIGVVSDAPAADDAYAAQTDALDQNFNAPPTVTLKYPKGADSAATKMQEALTKAGFVVKLKYRGDLADCQHEQIIQNSFRADDQLTFKLRNTMPLLDKWPVSMALDEHAPTDFTIVISPQAAQVQTELSSQTPSGSRYN